MLGSGLWVRVRVLVGVVGRGWGLRQMPGRTGAGVGLGLECGAAPSAADTRGGVYPYPYPYPYPHP